MRMKLCLEYLTHTTCSLLSSRLVSLSSRMPPGPQSRQVRTTLTSQTDPVLSVNPSPRSTTRHATRRPGHYKLQDIPSSSPLPPREPFACTSPRPACLDQSPSPIELVEPLQRCIHQLQILPPREPCMRSRGRTQSRHRQASQGVRRPSNTVTLATIASSA
jgi:hypothetical protein